MKRCSPPHHSSLSSWFFLWECENVFAPRGRSYSSFDLLTANISYLDLNLTTLCSPSAWHNRSSSLSWWSCQIIIAECSPKTKKQGQHIITAMIACPQIPIISLSRSSLMTISTRSVTTLYLQLCSTLYLQQGKASCLHRSQNNEAALISLKLISRAFCCMNP